MDKALSHSWGTFLLSLLPLFWVELFFAERSIYTLKELEYLGRRIVGIEKIGI